MVSCRFGEHFDHKTADQQIIDQYFKNQKLDLFL